MSDRLPALQAIGAVVVLSGGAFLLTQLARDAGKRLEKELFAGQDCLPSVAIMRHGDGRVIPLTKARYHAKLAAAVGVPAPTAETEGKDQAGADSCYGAWSDFLRTRARDDPKKHAHVHRENINYGFRRNLVGLRPIGIGVCVFAIALTVAYVGMTYGQTGRTLPADAGALALELVFLFLWLLVFTKEWVIDAANAYAARLFESAESLSG